MGGPGTQVSGLELAARGAISAVDPPTRTSEFNRRRRSRRGIKTLLTTLLIWLAAHLIVAAFLMLFGMQLESQSPAVRALLAIGLLAVVMAHRLEHRLIKGIGSVLGPVRRRHGSSGTISESREYTDPF